MVTWRFCGFLPGPRQVWQRCVSPPAFLLLLALPPLHPRPELVRAKSLLQRLEPTDSSCSEFIKTDVLCQSGYKDWRCPVLVSSVWVGGERERRLWWKIVLTCLRLQYVIKKKCHSSLTDSQIMWVKIRQTIDEQTEWSTMIWSSFFFLCHKKREVLEHGNHWKTDGKTRKKRDWERKKFWTSWSAGTEEEEKLPVWF